MGALDFLFEGRPPPSTTTYGTTVSGMPQWLSDYTLGLVSRANAIGGEPYPLYGGPRIAGFTPDQQNAFTRTRETSGAYIPGLQQASNMTTAVGSGPGGLSIAQPYINQAARTFPGAAAEYMNPYSENVVNRASQLTERALNEQLLPALESKFGGSGQDVRSSAYRRAADRGVRDLAEGLQGQAQAALAQGYDTAAQTFGQDAGRMGALAQTTGSLYGQDATQKLEAGRQTGALAELGQQLGLREAGALETIGGQQQAQTQRSLDTAFSDFERQQDYPRETIDWMSSVIRGMPYTQTTSSSSTGPASAVGPSPIASLASLATGIGGIWSNFQNNRVQQARGGLARKKRPKAYARGGLSYVAA